MIRGGISAGIEQGVVSRATHRQPGSGRKLIVQPSQGLVYPAREVHVDVEGRVRTVVRVGPRLPLVFVTAEEMHAILDDRPAQRSAQLLVRIRQNALADKVRGVELVITEIAGERAAESVRSRLGDGINEHAGRAPLAGIKPVRDYLELSDRVAAVARLLRVGRGVVVYRHVLTVHLGLRITLPILHEPDRFIPAGSWRQQAQVHPVPAVERQL